MRVWKSAAAAAPLGGVTTKCVRFMPKVEIIVNAARGCWPSDGVRSGGEEAKCRRRVPLNCIDLELPVSMVVVGVLMPCNLFKSHPRI